MKGLDGKNDNGQGVGGEESTNREIRRFPIRRCTVFVCLFHVLGVVWFPLLDVIRADINGGTYCIGNMLQPARIFT